MLLGTIQPAGWRIYCPLLVFNINQGCLSIRVIIRIEVRPSQNQHWCKSFIYDASASKTIDTSPHPALYHIITFPILIFGISTPALPEDSAATPVSSMRDNLPHAQWPHSRPAPPAYRHWLLFLTIVHPLPSMAQSHR